MKSHLIRASLLVVATSLPLAAQDAREDIAAQLRAQGYSSVEVSRTWLGRLRFVASTGEQTREIIVNPRTGEILRDFSEANARAGIEILDRPAFDPTDDPTDRGQRGDGRPTRPERDRPADGRPNGDGAPGRGGGQGGGQNGGPSQ